MTPTVSFVVPCYKLAHTLSDCVRSILAQTYSSLEVLILDDCSPDHTAQVASTFGDDRVRHIRNETNLGHLRNYNKGICMASGKYVWMLSADDYLRKPYILARYVKLLEANPRVGYVICPAMGLTGGEETGIVNWTCIGDRDRRMSGRTFLKELLKGNCVSAASALVRRECYERVSLFPTDLPHAGDWYLWCIFALHYDVAYLAEPMIYYRMHGMNMSTVLRKENAKLITEDGMRVRWRMLRHAAEAGERGIVRQCEDLIATKYAILLAETLLDGCATGLTFDEFEAAARENGLGAREEQAFRARVYTALADQCYGRGEHARAREFYRLARTHGSLTARAWIKYLLTHAARSRFKAELKAGAGAGRNTP